MNLYIWLGLNKFLALLPWNENFEGGSTRSLAYTDHIIEFCLIKFLALLARDRNYKFKDHYSNQKGIY